MNPQLDVSSILLNFPHDSLLTGTQKKSFGDLKMLQLESVFLWESNACLKLERLRSPNYFGMLSALSERDV